MLGVQETSGISANKQKGTGTRRKSRTVGVVAIEAMDRDDCIERWWQMFGVAPPRYTSLEFMRKAVAYEAQVKAFGGHSNAVQRALKTSFKGVLWEVEISAPGKHETIQHYTGASDASKVTNSTRTAKSTKPSVLSIRAGTHLVREWNGRTYQVEALEKGFLLDGKTYRSLSAIAKKITGAHWSGPRFFGLES